MRIFNSRLTFSSLKHLMKTEIIPERRDSTPYSLT